MKRIPLQGKHIQGILLFLLLVAAFAFPRIMQDKPYWLYVALQSFFWAIMAACRQLREDVGLRFTQPTRLNLSFSSLAHLTCTNI